MTDPRPHTTAAASRRRLAASAVALALVLGAPVASADGASQPVGTWLVDVQFPAQLGNPPLGFKEILVLHHGGTVSETNTTLNAASGVLGFADGGLGLVGSEGYGSWRRTAQGRIEVVFHKLVSCGSAAGLCGEFGRGAGQPLGYLVARFTATVRGDTMHIDAVDSDTRLVIGDSPDSPVAIPFGGANSTGVRLR